MMQKVNDIPCLFISSSIPEELLRSDFILEKSHPSFQQTGLKFFSVFRAHKLALVEKSLVIRVLGNLDRKMMKEIDIRLKIALGLE